MVLLSNIVNRKELIDHLFENKINENDFESAKIVKSMKYKLEIMDDWDFVDYINQKYPFRIQFARKNTYILC